MKEKSEGTAFSLISKYRTVLMGVAILAILFCHASTSLRTHGMELTRLANWLIILTVGVDVFMFLSGFGLYYSLSRNYYSYAAFIKKRFLRIIPYYCVLAGITYLIVALRNSYPAVRLFEDFFFISWGKRKTTKYWFILAILVFYAVFPLVYQVIQRCGEKWIFSYLLFFVVYWLITAAMNHFGDWYMNYRIAIERFPIFVLGACCGKMSLRGKRCPNLAVIGVIIVGFTASALIYLSGSYKTWINHTHFLYYLTRGLLSLAVIGTGVLVMETLEKRFQPIYTFLFKCLTFLGGVTLELYLFHQSYAILFDYPYTRIGYLTTMVFLPLLSACLLDWARKRLKNKRV